MQAFNNPDLQVAVVVVVVVRNKSEGGKGIGLWSESQGRKNPGTFKSWPGPPLVYRLGSPQPGGRRRVV